MSRLSARLTSPPEALRAPFPPLPFPPGLHCSPPTKETGSPRASPPNKTKPTAHFQLFLSPFFLGLRFLGAMTRCCAAADIALHRLSSLPVLPQTCSISQALSSPYFLAPFALCRHMMHPTMTATALALAPSCRAIACTQPDWTFPNPIPKSRMPAYYNCKA